MEKKPKNNPADAARKAAASALVRVHKGGWANLSVGSVLAKSGLSLQERAFAGAIFFGATERLATLDFLLASRLKGGLGKLDTEVRAILECGAYQLYYMRVPQSAAVNESVRLARAFGKTSAAPLVNAVLRRLLREVPVLEGENGAPAGPDLSGIAFESEAQRVQVEWSVSGAVAAAVMQALPKEYDAFFAASFASGEECLRVNTLKTTRQALMADFEARQLPCRVGALPGAVYARLPGGPAGEALFEAGHYHVQGEASQLACACLEVQPGQKVLDLCAAPGGKTATLAQMMGGGAGLTACELRPNRVPLIGQTLKRLGIAGAVVAQGDGTVYNPALAGQHRVLCDVPCSGLGVLAQKPDMRMTDGANFAALPAVQLKLLANAARYVDEGGRLVYSTCTIRPEENGEVVRAFLKAAPGWRVVPPAVAPKGAVLTDGMMTLLPHHTGLDGFFIAALEKG